MSPIGKYYISILIDKEKELSFRQKFSKLATIEIDLGPTDFAVISNYLRLRCSKFYSHKED